MIALKSRPFRGGFLIPIYLAAFTLWSALAVVSAAAAFFVGVGAAFAVVTALAVRAGAFRVATVAGGGGFYFFFLRFHCV